VHALCAALEALEASLDAEVDRLVVARLEVQSRNVIARSPIAAPECALVDQVERGAKALAVAIADHEQHTPGQRSGDRVEEVERKIRRGMVRVIGAFVTLEEEREIRGRDVGAGLADESHARFAQPAPLLP